ncbi:MAG: J domain-containing protein [Proteobacteria bacterium]|nr:J domain-containing protein [Pseudomonadota bacterium]
MSKDLTLSDYYKTLGLSKGASGDEIKKSYRKLALQHHPDRNKGDKASEDKFKEISEAYAVLSDDEKRKQYDSFGDSRFHQQYSQEDIFRNTDFGSVFQDFDMSSGGGLDGIFSRIFGGAAAGGGSPFGGAGGGRAGGGGRGGRQVKGQDVEFPLQIGFAEAFSGGERAVNFRLSDGTERSLKVRLPKGAKDGGRLRVAGMGAPSPYGGQAGDLFVILQVAPHPFFTRDGDDLITHVPLKISEALLGTARDVETMDGFKRVKIPAGVKPGTKVRLRGLGFPHTGKESRGDCHVIVDLEIPTHLTPSQKTAIVALQEVDL